MRDDGPDRRSPRGSRAEYHHRDDHDDYSRRRDHRRRSTSSASPAPSYSRRARSRSDSGKEGQEARRSSGRYRERARREEREEVREPDRERRRDRDVDEGDALHRKRKRSESPPDRGQRRREREVIREEDHRRGTASDRDDHRDGYRDRRKDHRRSRRRSRSREEDTTHAKRHHRESRPTEDDERRRRGHDHRGASPEEDSRRPKTQHHDDHHSNKDTPSRKTSTDVMIRSRAALPSQASSFQSQQGNGAGSMAAAGPAAEKQKPNFQPTGLLAAASNTIAQADGSSIVLKYHEPAEARKPAARDDWQLFVFKGPELLDTLALGARSCWLVGRAAAVADLRAEHASVSGQHAALQFRFVERVDEFGERRGRVRPYLIDLESANGTRVNGDPVAPSRYLELKHKDLIQFGHSTREYVLMLAPRDGS